MAAVTPTKVASTELSGDKKIFLYTAVPTTASDTITFVAATHKFRTIYEIICTVETGNDAALQNATATWSGLVVTLKTWGGDGAAATDWTTASVRLFMIVGSA